jgi:dethiobiotin synthetase
MIDLAAHLWGGGGVVLVSRHYLGSINHTLLSLEALATRKIPVCGVIFNGAPRPESESVVIERTGVTVLGRIDECNTVTPDWVRHNARRLVESGLRRALEATL